MDDRVGLLIGLVGFKTIITTSLGPFFGLSKSESVVTGLLLSGGGEFMFVVLTLADRLAVIPDKLAKVLVGVVVLSMALTPTLGTIGEKLAEYFEEREKKEMIKELSEASLEHFNSPDRDPDLNSATRQTADPNEVSLIAPSLTDSDGSAISGSEIVICGFGQVGQTIASFIQRTELMEKR